MAKKNSKEKAFNHAQATEGELDNRLHKTQQDLFKLRFRAASAPIKNTMEIRQLRREVARISTFLNQQRTASKAAAPKAAAPKAAAPKAAAPKPVAAGNSKPSKGRAKS